MEVIRETDDGWGSLSLCQASHQPIHHFRSLHSLFIHPYPLSGSPGITRKESGSENLEELTVKGGLGKGCSEERHHYLQDSPLCSRPHPSTSSPISFSHSLSPSCRQFSRFKMRREARHRTEGVMEREGWIGDVCERRDPSPPPSHASSSFPTYPLPSLLIINSG